MEEVGGSESPAKARPNLGTKWIGFLMMPIAVSENSANASDTQEPFDREAVIAAMIVAYKRNGSHRDRLRFGEVLDVVLAHIQKITDDGVPAADVLRALR
jgi:hypothetical protein